MKYKKVRDKEKREIVSLYYQNYSIVKIAEIIHRGKETVRQFLLKLGFNTNRKTNKSIYEIDKENGHKICSKCEKTKELSDFSFLKKRGRYRAHCKKCEFEKNRNRLINSPTIKNGKKLCNKCSQVKNIKDFLKKYNSYNSICKECANEYNRNYYHKDLELTRAKNRERRTRYFKENPKSLEKYRQTVKKWKIKNKKIISKKRNIARKLKRLSSEHTRLKENLRARLNCAVKLQKAKKAYKTMELLGCDIDFFKKYLESKFLNNMSWENYGVNGWHIDHIIPCDAFDLSLPEQQKICFHYTNLQPLWAKDNYKKSNKIIIL